MIYCPQTLGIWIPAALTSGHKKKNKTSQYFENWWGRTHIHKKQTSGTMDKLHNAVKTVTRKVLHQIQHSAFCHCSSQYEHLTKQSKGKQSPDKKASVFAGLHPQLQTQMCSLHLPIMQLAMLVISLWRESPNHSCFCVHMQGECMANGMFASRVCPEPHSHSSPVPLARMRQYLIPFSLWTRVLGFCWHGAKMFVQMLQETNC